MTEKILLGFQVDSGEPVFLPRHHTGITGMTGLAGKTTTNEAIAVRSNMRTLTFLTKRGEGAYKNSKSIPLFYRERSDWRYVESLLAAELREDQRFNRAWIITACRGAKSLREVWDRVKDAKVKVRKDSLSERVYIVLDAYFEIVVPNIEKYEFSRELQIGSEPGSYVMDLIGMPEAVQAVVIRSALDEILEHMSNVWPTIPEAWKFIGEVHTPVTDVTISIIKQGFAVNILLFIDSQDIASINPKIRGQIDNWILGRQKYEHEIERTLSAIPLPKSLKPKPEDIMRLRLGHFYAACSDWLKLVYVLPAGVPEDVGAQVARGELTPEYVRDQYLRPVSRVLEDEDLAYKEKFEEKERENEELRKTVIALRDHEKQLEAKLEKFPSFEAFNIVNEEVTRLQKELTELQPAKHLRDALLENLPTTNIPASTTSMQGPSEVGLQTVTTVVDVPAAIKRVTITEDTVKGKVFALAKKGFFDSWKSAAEVHKRLIDDANYCTPQAVNEALNQLVKDGLFGMKHTNLNRWKLAPNVVFEGKEVESQ